MLTYLTSAHPGGISSVGYGYVTKHVYSKGHHQDDHGLAAGGYDDGSYDGGYGHGIDKNGDDDGSYRGDDYGNTDKQGHYEGEHDEGHDDGHDSYVSVNKLEDFKFMLTLFLFLIDYSITHNINTIMV